MTKCERLIVDVEDNCILRMHHKTDLGWISHSDTTGQKQKYVHIEKMQRKLIKFIISSKEKVALYAKAAHSF